MSLSKILTATAMVVVMAGTAAHAADWFPFKLQASTTSKAADAKTVDYTPPQKASKPWNICVLYPYMQDSYWVSVSYGLTEEAKRLGVNVTALQAGGYSNLPKQLSQFDDCLASKADAILIAAVSEGGTAAKIAESVGKGVVTIGLVNDLLEAPVTAKITQDVRQKGLESGEYLVKQLGDKGGNVVAFPGPQGSGWAERYMDGFTQALKGTKVKLLAAQFGEASIPAQQKLVEDAIQTYPDMTAIWGGAPTAEAAIGAVKEAGLENVAIVASYENETMLKAVKDGEVSAVATEYPVIMGRIGIDLAVSALEKKLEYKTLIVPVGLVTKDNVATFDTTQIFAPEGTRPVFSVKAN